MDIPAGAQAKTNQPCAACKTLRRRCSRNCLFAPYFPAGEVENFARVHKVFGASNIIKMLQLVEEAKREDAVKSMVYEANARIRDPVYGSAGAIYHLQKHIQELEEQLEVTRARAMESQEHIDGLLRILMSMNNPSPLFPMDDSIFDHGDFLLEGNMGYDPVKFPME